MSATTREPPTVLYVVSRFPAITETFVVNEWLALSGRFRMTLAALRRGREPTLQPESRRALQRVRFLDAVRPAAVGAHVAWLARRPGAYLAALSTVLRGGLAISPRYAVKEAVVFAQAAPLASTAVREGVAHVHAHFANHPATAAWVVHRLTGIPFSFTAHANDLFVGPALLERKAADARFAIAVSDYNHRLLRERCSAPRRVEVVHCGVDTSRYTWRGLERRERDRIVCVASLSAKKGHVHLVDAVALLAERRRDLVLELIGEGPERERILARARERGVADRVRLLGARPWEDVRAALARARAFALASVRLPSGRMEGIPVALMEAMASGAPVVATRLSGIPELVRDGVTGLLVDPQDAAGLAEAMARLLDDDALARELAANARALVERSFSLTGEAGRLGDLFAEAISA
jgi:glycosyltransferase involved in cell wall biosynthesis